mmetsp:Transcript_6664/g.13346  ORF Transcript_6664/g.13346 Transcript_6664/m.13346 type:complete len:205 (+) Transcript_6664:622-1236(+)
MTPRERHLTTTSRWTSTPPRTSLSSPTLRLGSSPRPKTSSILSAASKPSSPSSSTSLLPSHPPTLPPNQLSPPSSSSSPPSFVPPPSTKPPFTTAAVYKLSKLPSLRHARTSTCSYAATRSPRLSTLSILLWTSALRWPLTLPSNPLSSPVSSSTSLFGSPLKPPPSPREIFPGSPCTRPCSLSYPLFANKSLKRFTISSLRSA